MGRASSFFSWEKKVKECCSCKTVKDLSAFRRSGNCTDDEKTSGFYTSNCRECGNKKSREHQAKKTSSGIYQLILLKEPRDVYYFASQLKCEFVFSRTRARITYQDLNGKNLVQSIQASENLRGLEVFKISFDNYYPSPEMHLMARMITIRSGGQVWIRGEKVYDFNKSRPS